MSRALKCASCDERLYAGGPDKLDFVCLNFYCVFGFVALTREQAEARLERRHAKEAEV